jgi:hypothetical protein
MQFKSSAEMLAEMKAKQTPEGTESKPFVVNRLRDLKEVEEQADESDPATQPHTPS